MPRYRLTQAPPLSVAPRGRPCLLDFRPDPASRSFLFGFPADTKGLQTIGLDSAPNLEALKAQVLRSGFARPVNPLAEEVLDELLEDGRVEELPG
jgi:hypothetical protein